jgi:hypothetical protein
MEGNNRLTRARTTLDDEHTRLRRPDNFVLLRLNRCDDVTKRAGSATLNRRNQRAVPAQFSLGGRQPIVTNADMTFPEEFIFETEN